MSGVERRRLCCAVLFHCVAALCVMWSLFVLIDRAAEEIQRGLIGKFICIYFILLERNELLMVIFIYESIIVTSLKRGKVSRVPCAVYQLGLPVECYTHPIVYFTFMYI